MGWKWKGSNRKILASRDWMELEIFRRDGRGWLGMGWTGKVRFLERMGREGRGGMLRDGKMWEGMERDGKGW